MTRKTLRALSSISVLLVVLCVLAYAASSLDPGPLERHIRVLKGGLYKRSSRSFVTRFPSGAVHEQFTVSSDGYRYALFDASGVKLVLWSQKSKMRILYESWYGANHPKERLLEDDRSVSYTSFYKSGQKWEQYIYNKQKRIKSYDVYDRSGHLVRVP